MARAATGLDRAPTRPGADRLSHRAAPLSRHVLTFLESMLLIESRRLIRDHHEGTHANRVVAGRGRRSGVSGAVTYGLRATWHRETVAVRRNRATGFRGTADSQHVIDLRDTAARQRRLGTRSERGTPGHDCRAEEHEEPGLIIGLGGSGRVIVATTGKPHPIRISTEKTTADLSQFGTVAAAVKAPTSGGVVPLTDLFKRRDTARA
jgi:hypothetical protein